MHPQPMLSLLIGPWTVERFVGKIAIAAFDLGFGLHFKPGRQ